MEIVGTLILLFLLLLGLSVVEGNREGRKLKVKEYELVGKKIDREIKIALISDFHNSSHLRKQIIDAVAQIKPDLICVPGDMLKSKEKNKSLSIASKDLLIEISEYAPVYFSLGNHELKLKYGDEEQQRFLSALEREMSEAGVNVLDNESILLKGIRIYGYSADLTFYRRIVSKKMSVSEINDAIGSCDDRLFNILLAHTPEYFNTYSLWGADLILSGHNHGGLIRLPFLGGVLSPRLHLFPKYDYGLYRLNGRSMIVSNGIGSHGIKIRVNNYPEIQVIKLKK